MADKPKVQDLVPIIQHINSLMRARDFAEIDRHLAERVGGVEGEPVAVLITWLRSTFPARTWLPHWSELRDASAAEIERAGKDAKVCLQGLWKPVNTQNEWASFELVQYALDSGLARVEPLKAN